MLSLDPVEGPEADWQSLLSADNKAATIDSSPLNAGQEPSQAEPANSESEEEVEVELSDDIVPVLNGSQATSQVPNDCALQDQHQEKS
jgi:hypothetical protein